MTDAVLVPKKTMGLPGTVLVKEKSKSTLLVPSHTNAV
jgi:hypothetical protein